jgi:nitrate/TMAO reductase-like tetraheme cytochrome c subunit
MKSHPFFRLLMIVVSGFLFVQCTSDPIPGPPGQDGIDGVDGVDGQDGVSGTASCVSCHSNSTREPILASFELSLHGSGTTFGRGSSANCAQCHGSEGFIDYVTIGAVDTTAGAYSPAVPFNCAPCHSSHRTFDFENDGPDFALRNPDAQNLVLDPTYTIDFGGSSNNCITCHQPRNSYEIPAVNTSGTYIITSSRFGPHYGPQSTMLEGILGAPIAGSTAYPGAGTATHRTAASCVSCHMGESNVADLGGHSWLPTDESCIQCHPNGIPDEMNGFTEGMATLAQLLANVVGEEYAEDADGNLVGTGVPIVGIIVNGSARPGIWPTEAAQAAWNYKTLEQDQSRGIHNPGYSRALLNNSIEALQNN